MQRAVGESTFIQGVTDLNESKETDLSNWKPSSNIVKENISGKDLFD